MGKRYQLMFVPDDGSQVRSFRVSSSWIPGLLTAGVLAVIFVSASTVSLINTHRSQNELRRVRVENAGLREHLEDFSVRIDDALAVAQENESMEREARLLAGLDPVDDQTRQLGVGGPLAPAPRFTDDPGIRHELVDQFQRLDELEQRLAFQTRSYEETLGALDSNRERLDHTPTIEPLRRPFALSSGYGWRQDPFTGDEVYHYGLDFRAPIGTPVRATAAGKVTFVGVRGDYGLTVLIDHGNGVETKFAHLESTRCHEGDRVQRGDIIAALGSSGRSTGPHVHYEVRVNGVAQNPARYIVNRDVDAR
ncbi:MAG: M23 family metallopeptidase [Candidatus Eisenbacteria bacterium]|uniref:M23 family metallopeptidase n=1 Tax=Eiseniibacteriota bacterium TaxID=2212470 RepID=A0A956LYV5_UNCEI|nr:M23 family metallopeptidase [Candidatus Eisenbacteria bacterium]